MTITSESRTSGPYSPSGAGGVGPYNYTFRIDANTEIVVTRTDAQGTNSVLTLTTHYTVAGVGADAGGTVTLADPPGLLSGEQLTLHGEVPFLQPEDITDEGSWDPETIERQLDRTVMMAQQLNEVLDRTYKVAVGSTGVNVVAEDYTQRPVLLDEHSIPAGPAVNYLTCSVIGSSYNNMADFAFIEFEFALVASDITHANLTLELQVSANGTFFTGGAYDYAMRSLSSLGVGTNVAGSAATSVPLMIANDFADNQTNMAGRVRMGQLIAANAQIGMVDVSYIDPATSGVCTHVRGAFANPQITAFDGFRLFLTGAPVNLTGIVRLWGHPKT
jgi:hypothetical protein